MNTARGIRLRKSRRAVMAAGLPYDSDAGRDYAACVTAIMCGEAYLHLPHRRTMQP